MLAAADRRRARIAARKSERSARCAQCGARWGGSKDIALLGEKLNLPTARIWKRGRGQGTSWEIELADGRNIILGNADSLLMFRRVRAAVLNATQKMLPHHDRQTWDAIVTLIAAVPEETQTTTEEEETEEHVREFLSLAYCFADASTYEVL